MDTRYDVLTDAARLSRAFVDGLADRPVGAAATVEELHETLNRPLTDAGEDPRTVVAELVRDADPGLVASAGPRYFGFVIGGALPVAVAADWLTSAWDQNAGGTPVAPALVVAEQIAADWVRELLGLPAGCGVGFVTGCQMAHVTCLAAARHAVLADAGWNVEADGLQGAPPLRVLAGAGAHVTIARACRLLGLGADSIRVIATDEQGRMLASELDAALGDGHGGPQIVCAQAGDVNSGAFDPLDEIVAICRRHGAWCHVDGAFGLWAAASPSRRELLRGHDGADSWATDGHKWLNVPYDCGIAIVADPARQYGAMSMAADYIPSLQDVPWGVEATPEFSRRARGVPLYAALRTLGRDGVADLVDRCCEHARHFAQLLAAADGIEVLNDVVLNQVLVRFGGDDAVTDAVIERVQAGGVCWAAGSRWHGKAVMRLSVIGWQTTTADIERSAAAIIAAAAS